MEKFKNIKIEKRDDKPHVPVSVLLAALLIFTHMGLSPSRRLL
jgi:hypothetical protein